MRKKRMTGSGRRERVEEGKEEKRELRFTKEMAREGERAREEGRKGGGGGRREQQRRALMFVHERREAKGEEEEIIRVSKGGRRG